MISVIQAKVVSTDNIDRKNILVPNASPAITGDGSVDLVCGYCGTALIKHARPNLAICNMIIRCPHCHQCNDTLDMKPG